VNGKLFPNEGQSLDMDHEKTFVMGYRTPFQASSIHHSNTGLQITHNINIGCPRRNVTEFGRVFRMLKYTDITQNTYVQIGTVTEIMAREF